MARDDDFGEVPDLGPARDELDQPPPKAPPKATPRPQVSRDSRPAATAAATPAPRGGGQGGVYLLLLLVIASMGGFGFWSFQQQQRLAEQLASLQSEQRVAGAEIANLDGLISTTDENASKSGAALQAQLRQLLAEQEGRVKHVDSELAKLWAVAYQRNKPALEALEKTVAGLDQQLSQLSKQLESGNTQLKQLAAKQSSAEKVLTNTGAALNELTASQAQMREDAGRLSDQLKIRDQANQELDELQDSQLKQQARQLSELKQNPPVPAALRQQVEEQARAIDSINAFRKQINQELLKLRDRVNALQLAAPKSPAS